MESMIGAAPGGQGSSGAHIKDADMQSFAKDVLDASMTVPVLVDFWAPWCGPCAQLTPALEKLVTEAKGAIKLVKINVDENQMLAQQLRIQSLPTVMAFKAGRPVDGFQGALPDSQLKQFITTLVGDLGPTPVEEILAAADQALAAGALEDAGGLYAAVLEADPENAKAYGKLALIQVRLGNLDDARETLAAVPQAHSNHADVSAARAALTLAEETATAGTPEPFLAVLAANPDDHQARYDLALALTKAGAFDDAADALLEIVRRDRAWNDDAARKQLVKMFEAFGHTSPFTLAARRKLSSLLFS
ncbi:thioredoxin [Govanella unica]|uniref:Thioredoxin n=1 Tax=Govanella unica TaxID=2975056 RepID=A0A9X3TVF6_9PROT|nr:thioredoxin [Govania unica]MDA5192432.1 thioredoxin [Govania unica]